MQPLGEEAPDRGVEEVADGYRLDVDRALEGLSIEEIRILIGDIEARIARNEQ